MISAVDGALHCLKWRPLGEMPRLAPAHWQWYVEPMPVPDHGNLACHRYKQAPPASNADTACGELWFHCRSADNRLDGIIPIEIESVFLPWLLPYLFYKNIQLSHLTSPGNTGAVLGGNQDFYDHPVLTC